MVVMWNVARILRDGTLLALIGSFYILALMRYNPRLFLNPGDFPKDILDAAPPKTEQEKRQALILGIPFFVGLLGGPLVSALALQREAAGTVPLVNLFLHTFGVLMIPNLVDLVVLDWLLFCTITPRFMVVPGTMGFAGYKDYRFHLRAHARGTALMAVLSVIVAAVVFLLG
jgi:hypothetical protein